VRALATEAGIALNVTLFTMTFKVLTARRVTLGQIRVSAVVTALTWQALQLAATLLLGTSSRARPLPTACSRSSLEFLGSRRPGHTCARGRRSQMSLTGQT
jgi:hypothetical protein